MGGVQPELGHVVVDLQSAFAISRRRRCGASAATTASRAGSTSAASSPGTAPAIAGAGGCLLRSIEFPVATISGTCDGNGGGVRIDARKVRMAVRCTRNRRRLRRLGLNGCLRLGK